MRTMLPLLLLAACSTEADEFRGVLPDERLVIDTAGFARSMRGAGQASENATMTLDAADGINQILSDVLGGIDEVTSFPPSWQRAERKALWGPWTDESQGLDGRLWVQKHRDGSYGWALELRHTGEGEDAWQAPIAGEIAAGSNDVTSSGGFVVDAALLDTYGEGLGALGVVAIDYTIDADSATGHVVMSGFAEELGDPVSDAVLSYTTTAVDGGSLDFVVVADTSEPQNGTEETVAMRSRWTGDGAGRSDGVITGGDAGILAFYETDCWDASLTSVFYENSYELRREGDEASCAFSDASYPAE